MKKNEFKIDWGSIVVDIVKKKDLDSYEFNNCWSENYDWTELDKHVIHNFYEEVIEWGIIRAEIDNIKIDNKNVERDLKIYLNNLG